MWGVIIQPFKIPTGDAPDGDERLRITPAAATVTEILYSILLRKPCVSHNA